MDIGNQYYDVPICLLQYVLDCFFEFLHSLLLLGTILQELNLLFFQLIYLLPLLLKLILAPTQIILQFLLLVQCFFVFALENVDHFLLLRQQMNIAYKFQIVLCSILYHTFQTFACWR